MRHVVGFIVPVVLGSAVLLAGSLAGCKAGNSVGFGGGGGGVGNGSGGSASGPSATGTNGSTGAFMTGAQTTGAGMGCTSSDCIGNGTQGGCDGSIAIDTSNAADGAKAIGLCQTMSPGGWGLVSAKWVKADGMTPLGTDQASVLGHGVLNHFGSVTKPREGKQLLALSSGTARNPTEPGYQDVGGFDKGHTDNPPTGYPRESPSCPGVMTGPPHDSAGLQLVIHTPKDAKSISFDENFHTYEFPDYICSEFNDYYVAMLSPKPANVNDPAGNIAFDSMGNNISVNASFLQVCDAQSAGGKNFACPLGSGALAGTGFGADTGFGQSHAATGWLNTKAPVPASTDITLSFAIWDSGDGILDSTVLIDNFKFQVDDTVTGTTPIPM